MLPVGILNLERRALQAHLVLVPFDRDWCTHAGGSATQWPVDGSPCCSMTRFQKTAEKHFIVFTRIRATELGCRKGKKL